MMLTTIGAHCLRGFVRIGLGIVHRRKSFAWKNTLQTSSLRFTFPTAFIKSLCTYIDSTEKLSIANDALCKADGFELEKKDDLQDFTTGSISLDKENILNGGKNSLNSKERAHFTDNHNVFGDEAPRTIDSNIIDSNFTNNKQTSLSGIDQYNFKLVPDWEQKKENSPGVKFPGDIYVIKNSKDEVKHMDILEQFLNDDALGFDTEHCPVTHHVCVVQLASQDKAVIWQCMNFKGKIPFYLKEILTGRVAKVGHACVEDAIKIVKQFNVEPVNLIDTNCWARDLRCSPQSLQAVCGIFLKEYLSKKQQRSNWKKANLSPAQICYAATDAWVSLRVYQEMKRQGEELGVTLTPIYSTLEQWHSEVQNNKRLRRRRRRQRLKERTQELLSHIESVEQTVNNEIGNDDDNTTGCTLEHATLNELHTIEETADIVQLVEEEISNEKVDSNDKQSKGSRRRMKKFLEKFHPLE